MSQHQMVCEVENVADEPDMCQESTTGRSLNDDDGDDFLMSRLSQNTPSPTIEQSSDMLNAKCNDGCDLNNSRTDAEAMVCGVDNIADEPDMCHKSTAGKSSSDAGEEIMTSRLSQNIPSPTTEQSFDTFSAKCKNRFDLNNSRTIAEAILFFLKLGIYPKTKEAESYEDSIYKVIPARMMKCASCRKRKKMLLNRHYMPLRNVRDREVVPTDCHPFSSSSERMFCSQNSQINNEPVSPVVERYAKIIISHRENETALPRADENLEELNNTPQERILVKSPTKEYSFHMDMPSKPQNIFSPVSPPSSDAIKDLNSKSVNVNKVKKNIFGHDRCESCNDYIEDSKKRPPPKKSPREKATRKRKLSPGKTELTPTVSLKRLKNSDLKKWARRNSTLKECSIVLMRLDEDVFKIHYEKYLKKNSRMITRSKKL